MCCRVELGRVAVNMVEEMLNEPDFCDPDVEDEYGTSLNFKHGNVIKL
jgi:hypothetical protein